MISQMYSEEKKAGGFTLLELLIVVSIIAILSVALIFVLNPAETLKKSRDAQRISDLATLKTSLALYASSTSTPYLGSSNSNTGCKATPTSPSTSIFYSMASSTGILSGTPVDGSGGTTVTWSATSSPLTDGTGWIPVNLDTLTGGSPISNLPVDPVNTATSTIANPATYTYRYACSVNPIAFEIDAALESTAYTVTDNKLISDGGNNPNYYEVGTNLKIIGNGTAF